MSGSQMNSSTHVLLNAEPDVQCLVCTRPFTLDTEVNDSFEALAICRECKTAVLNGNSRDEIGSVHRERRRRRPRSRATRFESLETAFSQRLSHLINSATLDHEVDAGTPPVSRQQASFTSTPNRSRRWHASDDESDGLSNVDSVFGETESNLSFGYDGEESDASIDQHARMGREVVVELDSESYLNTDTDIDPMNAGMDVWNSDDQEDEESEDSDFGEVVEIMQQRQQRSNSIAPSGFSEHESEDDAWTSGTAIPRTVGVTNLRTYMEGPAIRGHFIGNPGDHVDARQFEMLLEQFAEDNNNTRRGAPPAAKFIVDNLPSVVISTIHETNGGVTCPVCKDNMPARTVAKQLPCVHLYHSSCILPWLSYRNTCPVCRYELPTDDLEYERSKQATTTTNERGTHGVEHIHPQEPAEEISDGPEVEGSFNTRGGTTEEANTNGHFVRASQHPNRALGRHRWLVVAAAPVVSLVGLALVLCFANSSSDARRQLWRRSQSTSTAHVDAKRSWWSLF